MATKKAGGSAKNLKDSQPKYLGVKLYEGELARPGSIIIRQRGTDVHAGRNVAMGTDHTLFSLTTGKVKFGMKRKTHFDGTIKKVKTISVQPEA